MCLRSSFKDPLKPKLSLKYADGGNLHEYSNTILENNPALCLTVIMAAVPC